MQVQNIQLPPTSSISPAGDARPRLSSAAVQGAQALEPAGGSSSFLLSAPGINGASWPALGLFSHFSIGEVCAAALSSLFGISLGTDDRQREGFLRSHELYNSVMALNQLTSAPVRAQVAEALRLEAIPVFSLSPPASAGFLARVGSQLESAGWRGIFPLDAAPAPHQPDSVLLNDQRINPPVLPLAASARYITPRTSYTAARNSESPTPQMYNVEKRKDQSGAAPCRSFLRLFSRALISLGRLLQRSGGEAAAEPAPRRQSPDK